ncbi:MAG: hypothetical protein JW891_00490 [Candidatus Lokiarchaeota archaeon]|nr:hypothetical protein [Candidatus Lokiarchaeota archaeon]
MSEDKPSTIKLIPFNKENQYKCVFSDNKLKECVEIDTRQGLSQEASNIINKAVFNCIATMLNTCIGKLTQKLDFVPKEFNLTMSKTEEGRWKIDEINLDLIPQTSNKNLLSQLEQCLKFFKISCVNDHSVNFTISYFPKNPELKQYKKALLDIKDEFESILGRELNLR